MTSIANVALSGYDVAAKKIAVSANNVANQFSTSRVENGKVVNEPYQPQRVEAISQEEGGVRARVVDKNPAALEAPTAGGELQQVPNVDTAEELVNAKIATYDARANLAVIRAESKLQDYVIDIFT